jgi:PadR family transcriptional regulator, regulatory protein AphA
MTGYEIKRAYERGPAHFMSMSFGQIYPVLKQLTAEKLARRHKREGTRGSVRYSITASGLATLREWLFGRREQISSRELLLRLFFSPLEDMPALKESVEGFHQEEKRQLEHYRSTGKWLREAHGKNSRLAMWELTLDYGVGESKARVRWAEHVLALIDEVDRGKNEK